MCGARPRALQSVGTVIRPPPPISALWRPQKSAAGAIPSSLAYNTDMQENSEAKLRDIAPPRPDRNATRDLRGSA